MSHAGCFHAQFSLFFVYLTPKIQFLPPKVIVSFRDSVKIRIFPLIHILNGSADHIINFVVVEKTVPEKCLLFADSCRTQDIL